MVLIVLIVLIEDESQNRTPVRAASQDAWRAQDGVMVYSCAVWAG